MAKLKSDEIMEQVEETMHDLQERLRVFTENLQKLATGDKDQRLSKILDRLGGQIEFRGTEILKISLLLVILLCVVVFFGYKLYKSLVDKERKRDEKRKQKQQKKKK